MSDNHDHSIGETAEMDRRLWATLALSTGITVAEVIGGLLSSSLSLLSNAAHNFSDVLAVGLAMISRRLCRRPPTKQHTYGIKRVEVISALINSVSLLVIVVLIGREAITRILHPTPVIQQMMLIIGSIALVGNIGSVLLLRRHDQEDTNLRAAFLHMIQDALASVGVIFAALFAKTAIGPYVDAAAAILISLLVVRGALQLTWKTISNLLEGIPSGIDVTEVARQVDERFAPSSIHHLHIWELGPEQRLLTAHVSLGEELSGDEIQERFKRIKHFLADGWSINHATLEPEIVKCSRTDVLCEWNDTLRVNAEKISNSTHGK